MANSSIIPDDIDDYILIIKDDCDGTNKLLEMAHPDIQFVCRLNEGTRQMVVEEQFEKTQGGLYFKEVLPVNGKKQLYYCQRGSSFSNNENLKLYKYSNGFKEIEFSPYANNYGFKEKIPNGVFIKRSDRKGEPDNFPVKDSSIKLSEEDRKTYFDNMITQYNIAKYRVHGGGKRTKKRSNRKRKSTKRRRGTRKRANKKR